MDKLSRRRIRAIKAKDRTTYYFKCLEWNLFLCRHLFVQLPITDTFEIKKTIRHNTDLKLRNFRKLTSLHIACWCRLLTTVKKLIKTNVDVNAKDECGWTPLHIAAKHGSVKLSKYLLKHGADANIPNDDGILPLHFSSQENYEIFNLFKNYTSIEVIMKYCTFRGNNDNSSVGRSILCRALLSAKGFVNKPLIESVLISGLPTDVINCPVVVEDVLYVEEDNLTINYIDRRLYLLSPLCFFLWKKPSHSKKSLKFVKFLLDSNHCEANSYNSSDSLFVPGPIEVALRSSINDTFQIISVLLEKFDLDKECNGSPARLLNMCLEQFGLIDKCIVFLLLKATNLIEPEDLLRWIIEKWNQLFNGDLDIPDLVVQLIVLSPYVRIPSSLYNTLVVENFFVYSENGESVRELYEQSVRPLASYCRSVVRRQLHNETRNNYRQFTEILNLLPVSKVIIDYLKYNEVHFIFSKETRMFHVEVIV